MTSFTSLTQIIDMDFTQMRALPAPGGARATDAALVEFTSKLNNFFVQFQKNTPSSADKQTFKTLMDKIIDKINVAEYAYYLEKYRQDEPEQCESMAQLNKITGFEAIPKRMQYWAASDVHGGTVRNLDAHKTSVLHLETWAKYFIDRPEPSCRLFSSVKNTARDQWQPQAKISRPS